MQKTHKYDDIIEMEHPVSKKHPRMDAINRAAQFSPFQALGSDSVQKNYVSVEHDTVERVRDEYCDDIPEED